jgi:hypothetical protein
MRNRHERAGPVGSCETRTSPATSTATHNDLPGQEIAVSSWRSIRRSNQDDELVPGWVELRTSPALSTATHSDTDGHETPSRIRDDDPALRSATKTLHRGRSDEGLRDTATRSPTSTPTHSDTDGQDTPENENGDPNGGP